MDIAQTPDTSLNAEANSDEVEQSPQDVAEYYLDEIAVSEKASQKWQAAGDKITRRYREEVEQNQPDPVGAKFNIFWANVQTLAPATYSRRPKVEVTRRFKDGDPVGRVASMILERALQYEVDCRDDLHFTMKQVVLDRLLPGQGVAWVRYEPSFAEEEQDVPSEDGLSVTKQTVEVIADEHSPVDYVFWKDFVVSQARTWADVRWVAKKIPFSKLALKARFGETAPKYGANLDEVPCDYDPISPEDKKTTSSVGMDSLAHLKRALVYEVWDKELKRLVWVVKGYKSPLDIKEDVLNLEDFWPTPRPLYATQTNDKLEPVADFTIYKKQIRELDNLTARISLLVSALRVIGVYDASQPALATLLSSGVENRMVPVNQWAAFAEKGGLKGVTDFFPLDQVVKVLTSLYEARDQVKQTVYELTGMADIIRGASQASETLGAQQIKAKFANLRLSARQQEVAEFVTKILQIKAEIMCSQYSAETLKRISAADQLPAEDQARVDEAITLLQDERTRMYRIEVLAASLVELDEVDETRRRNDFMSAVSNFMLAMKNLSEGNPEMAVPALEMLKFVVRGFSVGRALEASIDDAADKIKERIANPKPPAPNPDLVLKKEIAVIQEQAENARAAAANETKTDIAEMQAALKLVSDGMASMTEQYATIRGALDTQTQGGGDPAGQPSPPPDLAPLQEMLAAMQAQMGRKRIKTPIYDPETGDILRVEESFEDPAAMLQPSQQPMPF